MGKKSFIDPNFHRTSRDMRDCQKMFDELESALEQHPVDFDKINEVIYIITDPLYKYPKLEKCSPNCTAPKINEMWKKAIDTLKTMQGITDIEELWPIMQMSQLLLLEGKDYHT